MNFFNGGVNWLNLPMMRGFNFLEKCVTLAEEDRSLRYEEDLMNIVARNKIEFHKRDPRIFCDVYYDTDLDESAEYSLLHFKNLKKKWSRIIPAKYQKFFNHYYFMHSNKLWDFKVPFYLLPFKLIPYKLRKLILKRGLILNNLKEIILKKGI